jgi:hypothetical protein
MSSQAAAAEAEEALASNKMEWDFINVRHNRHHLLLMYSI